MIRGSRGVRAGLGAALVAAAVSIAVPFAGATPMGGRPLGAPIAGVAAG